MDRHTFSWAPRTSRTARGIRQRRVGAGSTLRRCYDELSVIADHVAATGHLDENEPRPPIRR